MKIGITKHRKPYDNLRIYSHDHVTYKGCIDELVCISDEFTLTDVIESIAEMFVNVIKIIADPYPNLNLSIRRYMDAFFDKLGTMNGSVGKGHGNCFICYKELTDTIEGEEKLSDRIAVSKTHEVYVCRECGRDKDLKLHLVQLLQRFW